MKKCTISLIFLLAILVASCENAPRNRPTFSPFQDVTSDFNEDTEPETLVVPQRPDGAVFIQADACGCLQGKAITYGSNCASLCQQKGTGVTDATLYMNVKVGAEVELTDLRDLQGWCSTPLIDPNTGEAVAGNPACVLEAKDENGSVRQINFTPIGNKATVNITSLSNDMTYRISILETTSGARSDTLQIRKVSTSTSDPIMGPLRLMPVTQYTCMYIDIADSDSGNESYYDYASRLMYYFVPEVRPEAISEFSANLYCHDIYQFGTNDPGGTRLEETPGAFTLWSKWDPRFYDTDNDGINQIDQLIVQLVEDQGATIDANLRLFFEFSWFSEPQISSGDSSSAPTNGGNVSMGYYMIPWVDQNTLKAYCPKQEHYYSDNQLFVALRELVGVDTEGLYIGKKEGQGCTFMLIRETQLKKIWFYKDSNGIHIEPNNETVEGKKIQYYYPPDENSPFIKKSHQNLFTILSTQELSSVNCGGSSAPTSGQDANGTTSGSGTGGGDGRIYPPHDKRIGCVPVTSD